MVIDEAEEVKAIQRESSQVKVEKLWASSLAIWWASFNRGHVLGGVDIVSSEKHGFILYRNILWRILRRVRGLQHRLSHDEREHARGTRMTSTRRFHHGSLWTFNQLASQFEKNNRILFINSGITKLLTIRHWLRILSSSVKGTIFSPDANKL